MTNQNDFFEGGRPFLNDSDIIMNQGGRNSELRALAEPFKVRVRTNPDDRKIK